MGLQERQSNGLETMLFGTRSRKPQSGGSIEECKVHHTSTKGVYFTRPDFDGGKTVFGPAPFIYTTLAGGVDGHVHGVQPAQGDRLLVVWSGPSEANPWAVGWWPA